MTWRRPPARRPLGFASFDMRAYDDYLNDRLPEVEFDPAEEESALTGLPEVPVG